MQSVCVRDRSGILLFARVFGQIKDIADGPAAAFAGARPNDKKLRGMRTSKE